MFKLNRNRLAVATLCLGFAGTSALVLPAYADDMAKGMMAKDGMMSDPMMKMKDAMKDDASKMTMTQDLAKMMVMHQMAMQMCMDGKCQKMMSDDPATVKMMEDAKAMAGDAEKMKMMRDQISNDPEAMKQVMMMTLAQSMMMKDKMGMDHGMNKMDDAKMKMDKMK